MIANLRKILARVTFKQDTQETAQPGTSGDETTPEVTAPEMLKENAARTLLAVFDMLAELHKQKFPLDPIHAQILGNPDNFRGSPLDLINYWFEQFSGPVVLNEDEKAGVDSLAFEYKQALAVLQTPDQDA